MLEIFAFLGAILGAITYVVGIRRKAIVSARQIFARGWISEGDIYSSEAIYITLNLENTGGDLIGSISSNAHSRLLGVYADVGWFKTTLYISELRGRSVSPIITATLKLTDNNNRLTWTVEKNKNQNILPIQTVLWPCSDVSMTSIWPRNNTSSYFASENRTKQSVQS